jgi:ATP-dependent exoDNAse (exonuclease V) beta subunit
VDYKTGHAPDEYAAYHEQVSRYMDLLTRAQGLPVRGTLVYLDEHRLEQVGKIWASQ